MISINLDIQYQYDSLELYLFFIPFNKINFNFYIACYMVVNHNY